MEAPIQSEALATYLATKVLEKKATNVVILDMRELASYTDFFIIASASNRRQVQAIANSLRKVDGEETGYSAKGLRPHAGSWSTSPTPLCTSLMNNCVDSTTSMACGVMLPASRLPM
jgi:hypothetical protein